MTDKVNIISIDTEKHDILNNNVIKSNKNYDFNCPICFTEFDNITINNKETTPYNNIEIKEKNKINYEISFLYPCFHFICSNCFEEFKKAHDSCFICRKEIDYVFTLSKEVIEDCLNESIKKGKTELSISEDKYFNIKDSSDIINSISDTNIKPNNLFPLSDNNQLENVKYNNSYLSNILKSYLQDRFYLSEKKLSQYLENKDTSNYSSNIYDNEMNNINKQIKNSLNTHLSPDSFRIELIPFNKPKLTQEEETFSSITKDEIITEIKNLDIIIGKIQQQLFGKWNNKVKLHEQSLLKQTISLFTDIKELNDTNTCENHYDKNKIILAKLHVVITNTDKLIKKDFTEKEISEITKNDDELFSIGIPTTFEKIKKKKSKKR